MKTAGFDWLFLDLEHGQMSLDTTCQIAVTALGYGIAPIVRVPYGEYTMATRALDGGALGIIIPHVDDPEEAAVIADRLRYPPDGHRSIQSGLAQLNFTVPPVADAMKALNAATFVTVMLETPKAVENAEKIAAVPGIDCVLVGCGDLGIEMGIPGQPGDPRMAAALEKVAAACRKHGKVPGLGGVYVDELQKRYIALGYRFILAAGDVSLIMAAAKAKAETMRSFEPKR
jgi:2-keto-3-deoxy-L-rhamnonate aldolase RhmA